MVYDPNTKTFIQNDTQYFFYINLHLTIISLFTLLLPSKFINAQAPPTPKKRSSSEFGGKFISFDYHMQSNVINKLTTSVDMLPEAISSFDSSEYNYWDHLKKYQTYRHRG